MCIGNEASALAVLWYVINQQRRRWRDIGWGFTPLDLAIALGLVLGANIASFIAYSVVQAFYYAAAGHYLVPKSLSGMLGFGFVSSLVFVCLNPFFEELIVRAFVISEVIALGGKLWVAVIVSVALQVSYHLYQGAAHMIPITAVFLIFSIYYVRTRRIMPVILAHLYLRLVCLVRGGF
jgi:membrane protease YdiL (CAAX protease family)